MLLEDQLYLPKKFNAILSLDPNQLSDYYKFIFLISNLINSQLKLLLLPLKAFPIYLFLIFSLV